MMKVLCLHGKQQSAEILRTRFGRLPHKARNTAKFFFIDAPFLLELRGGDDIPMRTWFYREGDKILDETLETSLALLEDVWQRDGPFVGIFGFSMGGSLASILATMPLRFPGLQFVIVGGAPDVPSHLLDQLGHTKIPPTVKSLHLVGLADNVIPHHVSVKLSTRFSCPRVIEHEQGHCIPTRAAMLNTYVEFLEEMQACVPLTADLSQDIVQDTISSSSAPSAATVFPVLQQKSIVASDAIAALQSEEIEVLSSIFTPEEMTLGGCPTTAGQPTASCRVLLSPGYGAEDVPARWMGNLGITFSLHSSYPELADCVPDIEIFTGSLSLLDFPLAYRRDLLSTVRATASHICQDAGETCLLQCIQTANEWLGDAKWARVPRMGSGASSSANSDALVSVSGSESGCEGKGKEASGVKTETEALQSLEEKEARREEEWIRQATDEAGKAAALSKKTDASTSEECTVTEMDTSSVHVSASARGIWEYTVGLVGKPSAGKSTFYNAVTRAILDTRGHRHLAEVAPHPFTTIEPNIAPGWYASFHDDSKAETGRSSLHGRWDIHTVGDASSSSSVALTDSPVMLCHASENYRQRRVLPLIIKDVAGLVPGAYKGRGKGNRFLSDLCDADVLVHVVDVTGKSDRDGNIISTSEDHDNSGPRQEPEAEQAVGSTPLEDAEWIRYELHRWIFNNVKAKWHSVGRKGDNKCMLRVVALFSGYKGQSWNVVLAAQRAHLNLDSANFWSELDIHRLVAHFLCIRFPICLALNKIDELHNGDTEIVAQCQREARERGEVAVPISARAECWALHRLAMRSKRVMESLSSSSCSSVRMPPQGSQKWHEEESRLQKCIEGFGSTGVLEAISEAVKLKPPVLCYPVGDLDAETPVAWTASLIAGNEPQLASAPILRDCLQLKPGSTVEDLFEALKRGALRNATMHGDFVRAEGRGLERDASKKVQLRRDSVLTESNCVVRLMANRKSVWQNHVNETAVNEICNK